MRVLNVTGSLQEGGGIENVLLRVFRELLPRRASAQAASSASAGPAPDALPLLQLEICYIGRKPPAMQAAFEELGVAVWRCPESRNPLNFARRLAAELAARPPYDVLHTHNSNFGGPALAMARRAGVPVRIAHYHNLVSGHANDWARRLYEAWLRRQVLRHATAIVALTNAGLTQWFGRRAERDRRMTVLAHGVPAEFGLTPPQREAHRADVRAELGIPPAAFVVGHVGRFVWQKDHATLLQAFAALSGGAPEARLLLVGAGELQEAVRRQAQAAGLTGRVIFAGLRRDVPRVLAAMDVFALPSVQEGFSVALLEAQAVGLPVVTSDLPSIAAAVAPEFQAQRHAAGDAAGLAAQLERTRTELAEAGRAGELRSAAQRFAARFSVAASAQRWLELWRSG